MDTYNIVIVKGGKMAASHKIALIDQLEQVELTEKMEFCEVLK